MVGSTHAPTPQLRQTPHTTREIVLTTPQQIANQADGVPPAPSRDCTNADDSIVDSIAGATRSS